MRERHFPRVCESCNAPMARQNDDCWRCGTRWSTDASPPAKLQVLPGGAVAAAADTDQWASDGGSWASTGSAT